MAGIAEGYREDGRLNFTEWLVTPALRTLAGESARGLWGLLLAALYGVAMGTRRGGLELWQHVLGVPAGLAAVALVAVPSLFVFLALVDAPISPLATLAVAARSLALSGLMLAGIAPAAALFVVTIESAHIAGGAALVGLLLAGAVGLVRLLNGLSAELRQANPLANAGGNFALAVFSVFAAGLCLRVWWGLLPLLGGAS